MSVEFKIRAVGVVREELTIHQHEMRTARELAQFIIDRLDKEGMLKANRRAIVDALRVAGKDHTKKFRAVMDWAWGINDKLSINPDQSITFEGSTGDIDGFRDALHELDSGFKNGRNFIVLEIQSNIKNVEFSKDPKKYWDSVERRAERVRLQIDKPKP